jgi:putative FmdB family regulatory protein
MVCILLPYDSNPSAVTGTPLLDHEGAVHHMPLYDYRCTACGTTFEVSRQVGQAGEECCPECGGGAKRVFTPVGVHFKGSGFHNTDYRPKPKDTAPACPAGSDTSSTCDNCPAKQ